jgi:protein arginine kinase activator
MLCQNCNKRPASVHFTKIINNNKVELYLCEKCANEKSQLSPDFPINFNNFFSGLIGFGNSAPYVTSTPKGLVCDKCGMSYTEFQKLGKLGCSRCYELFRDMLKPVIRRLHGNTKHTGKVPAKVMSRIKVSEELERLRVLLDESVRKEEYEKAAVLRDKIKAIENGN